MCEGTLQKVVATNTKQYYKSEALALKKARFFNAEAAVWQYPPNCTTPSNDRWQTKAMWVVARLRLAATPAC
jgi:hypothetical protein